MKIQDAIDAAHKRYIRNHKNLVEAYDDEYAMLLQMKKDGIEDVE